MGSSMRFDTVLPREQVTDYDIAGLKGSGVASPTVVLAALYLRAGKYIPEAAKKRGAFFGYCDAEGNHLSASDPAATHFGVLADTEVPYAR